MPLIVQQAHQELQELWTKDGARRRRRRRRRRRCRRSSSGP